MRLFDSTNIPLLGKALDVYALRQKVVASNMANITTHGYKSKTVSFEERLASASQETILRGSTTHDNHINVGGAARARDVDPEVHDTSLNKPPGYSEMASGFNDVDIDMEMAELAKNQIRFKFGSHLLGNAFKGIQKAIRGTL